MIGGFKHIKFALVLALLFSVLLSSGSGFMTQFLYDQLAIEFTELDDCSEEFEDQDDTDKLSFEYGYISISSVLSEQIMFHIEKEPETHYGGVNEPPPDHI